ncbi:MAG: AAA family ATPase [Bacilli bacterium]
MNEKDIEIINIDGLDSNHNNDIETIDFVFDNSVTNDNDLNGFKILKLGDDLTRKKYITNPAIAREEEIKKLMMVLLTPDKSGLLIGKPGIGKTAIVEGLAYLIQRNEVPNALKDYRILKFNSPSLVGTINIAGKDEMIINVLVNELKQLSKVILFIDEIHTLIGSQNDGPMDLANILKPALDRGDIKAIGATTTKEYETYVIRDRAFLRRFERVDVLEPDQPTTVKILLGSLKRIENQTGIKFKYNDYMAGLLIESIVSATSEYKRIYGLAAMYPDVAFSVLSGAFSQALYQNKSEVDILDVYNAIKVSKRIYPDTIIKELKLFKEKFKTFCEQEHIVLPDVSLEDIKVEQGSDY